MNEKIYEIYHELNTIESDPIKQLEILSNLLGMIITKNIKEEKQEEVLKSLFELSSEIIENHRGWIETSKHIRKAFREASPKGYPEASQELSSVPTEATAPPDPNLFFFAAKFLLLLHFRDQIQRLIAERYTIPADLRSGLRSFIETAIEIITKEPLPKCAMGRIAYEIF